jgi:streptogramin lyase
MTTRQAIDADTEEAGMASSYAAVIPMLMLAGAVALPFTAAAAEAGAEPTYHNAAKGSHPHDVAAAPRPGGPVYYTAQTTGKLGILDPKSGKYEEIPLGANSAPYGVIVGHVGAPWVTDSGQNAIVRVDPKTRAVRLWAAEGCRVCESQHVDFRSEGSRLVHWTERILRPRRPRDRRHEGVEGPARARTVRDHDDAGGRRLLRVARRQPYRADRQQLPNNSYPSNRTNAAVRKMLGRAGEAWGAESGTERLVMIPAR